MKLLVSNRYTSFPKAESYVDMVSTSASLTCTTYLQIKKGENQMTNCVCEHPRKMQDKQSIHKQSFVLA